MNYRIIEDSELAKRNQSLLFCGSTSPAYNAVLSVVFSGENATEPILLQEAKDWCRIDGTDDDALVTKLIKAARSICEKTANKSFITRTISAKIHNGLGNFILPYGPVVSITSYTDKEGIAITGYTLVDSYDTDITVVYTAGYTTLPEDFRTAILCQIAWMYSNRGDIKLASSLSLESSLILQQVRNV